jgi:hypothetical protein
LDGEQTSLHFHSHNWMMLSRIRRTLQIVVRTFLWGPADPVSEVSFPFGLAGGGLFAIWATGALATEPITDFGDLPVSLIDCRSRQGQSGSPVIAYRSGGMVPITAGAAAAFAGGAWRLLSVYSP